MLSGCQDKTFDYQIMRRDIYKTGGNISFIYDEVSRTAIFGGEGETVQFYESDIAKDWQEAGCRVGVQILVPNEVDDFKSGSAVLDGQKIEAQDFFVEEEDGINYAVFQPLVSKEKSHLQLKIIWQDGFEEQTYNIVVKEGTAFMEK